MATRAKIPVTPSSGNVFADLGVDNPEEVLTKAKLVGLIWDEIEHRGLTQKAAADLMGIDQPKVSALMNGRLANFSSERLMRLLNALGQDIDIMAKPSNQPRGQIRVIAGGVRHVESVSASLKKVAPKKAISRKRQRRGASTGLRKLRG
jgi:predicted XRE-type DNA-binding protein